MAKRWIEAFRVGGKASRGIKPEHLAEVVDDDFEANPRALCFGHPKSDDPAAGKITGARIEGSSLMVEVDPTEAAVEQIRKGDWINRSAAFFDPHHEANPRPGKWTLRHVGLLGAAAPGIPNMGSLQKALAFDAEGGLVTEADPADAVIYAPPPTEQHVIFESKEPTMDPNDPNSPEKIAERAAAQDKREQEFAARMRRQFDAGNGSSIDALVTAGKILPAEAAGLKIAFTAFDPEGAELEFGSADKPSKATAAAHLLAFMAGLPKRVPVGDDASSPRTEFEAPGGGSSTDAHATARSLDVKARELMTKEPGLTFEAAIERVA